MNAVRPGSDNPQVGLRQKVLQGGAFLIARQGIGIAINTGGLFLLLWAIGPSEYGLFMAAVAFNSTLTQIAKSGIHIYLVRRPNPIDSRDYHQAFTLFVLTGIVGVAIAFLALPLLASRVKMEGFQVVASGLFAGLPLALLTLVPIVRLERALDYRRIASIELAAQIVYQGVTLPLAFLGWGAFAPVTGWWAQYLVSAVALYSVSGYRPRLLWEWPRIRSMMVYGISFSGSQWLWKVRGLVNPLIVGPTLGPAFVGYIALAWRLCDLLSFVKDVAWRLAISALARVQDDRERLVKAISDGTQLQMLAAAPLFAAFGLLAPFILPWIPSARATEWTPALQVFPFFAIAYLVHGLYSLQISALYVIGRNWSVSIFHVANLICFASAAWILVPRVGLVGFGMADAIASITFAVIHVQTVRLIGRVDYFTPAVWAVAFGLVPFWPELGWLAGVGLVVVALWPRTWVLLGSYTQELRGWVSQARSRRSPPGPVDATPGPLAP